MSLQKQVSVYSVLLILLLVAAPAFAGDESPPLPLHGVEGYGGIAITYSAYLVNPAEEGHIFGKPALGAGGLITEKGRFFGFATVTETIGDRLELGYAYNYLTHDDLHDEIERATTIGLSEDAVQMHNFNARLALLKEGQFNQSWLPALTAGIHYKYNDSVDAIDRELTGTLHNIGIDDNEGVDYTLYASKMLTFLPRPLLVNLGLRNSEAAHIGLLGFTGDREFLFEGNLVLFATKRLAIGAEYRQKPDKYQPIPGLIEDEDDWWSVVFGYVFNNHFTVSGGYFNMGDVLNEQSTNAYALKIKYEF
jgi:hypothetical protein